MNLKVSVGAQGSALSFGQKPNEQWCTDYKGEFLLGNHQCCYLRRGELALVALPPVHAVLHQVLQNQPQVWASIDHRMRALSATDDLITKVDGAGCDIKDLLLSELGPYGHVRFTLNGDRLFLPAKLAVSLALIFHELATNAGKYGAFSSERGMLGVSWSITDDRLNIAWDETEGPSIGAIGEAGFGTKLLASALRPFDGKTEISFLKSGVHCTMQCRVPKA